MTNLKKKILTLLISILSLFLVILIIIFNVRIYNKELNDVSEKFKMISSIKDNPIFNDSTYKYPIFEIEAYEVEINQFGEIDNIKSYSSITLSDDEIKTLINDNINNIKSSKLGSLYTSSYLFSFNRNGNLLIINNTNTKLFLFAELIRSIIVFCILEIIIIFISIKITKWIVKPVDDAFNKQKQFIYDASHELKTPIAIIAACTETLENNPKEKKWISDIKNENERMSKLVTNLLDLSKSENIKDNEIYSDINLSKLIKNKALSFESLMFEDNIDLNLYIEDNINFNCNGDRIKELLSILMDNAIKHSDKDSTITVNLFKEKNNVILQVKNQGDEIPLEDQDKIFERFYRVDKSRNRDEKRYGLGLSIAKNIVLNHNGTIKVNCSDGYTTFIVSFKQN